jgi:hypothetical protein
VAAVDPAVYDAYVGHYKHDESSVYDEMTPFLAEMTRRNLALLATIASPLGALESMQLDCGRARASRTVTVAELYDER